MTQSRLGSLIEAIVNIIVGFSVNFLANMLVFPLFGFQLSASTNLALGGIYTVISLVRSYCIRRWFNAKLHAMSLRAAQALEGK